MKKKRELEKSNESSPEYIHQKGEGRLVAECNKNKKGIHKRLTECKQQKSTAAKFHLMESLFAFDKGERLHSAV